MRGPRNASVPCSTVTPIGFAHRRTQSTRGANAQIQKDRDRFKAEVLRRVSLNKDKLPRKKILDSFVQRKDTQPLTQAENAGYHHGHRQANPRNTSLFIVGTDSQSVVSPPQQLNCCLLVAELSQSTCQLGCLNFVAFKRREFLCLPANFAATSDPVYEERPRKAHRGVDLISDALPFGRLWYGEPNAVSNAIEYAKFRSRSHDTVIRVYDDACDMIEIRRTSGCLPVCSLLADNPSMEREIDYKMLSNYSEAAFAHFARKVVMMRTIFCTAGGLAVLLIAFPARFSDPSTPTQRLPQFENSHVRVWKSTSAPNGSSPLHRHAEFAAEKHGYSATKHRHQVGTGYFHDAAQVIAVGLSCHTELRGSTEHEQLH
jgi:hypothetical protein